MADSAIALRSATTEDLGFAGALPRIDMEGNRYAASAKGLRRSQRAAAVKSSGGEGRGKVGAM